MWEMTTTTIVNRQGRHEVSIMKERILKSIAIYALNWGLNWVLSHDKVQDKQKQLVKTLNTILDALRDHKLTSEELILIKTRLDELFSK